MLNDLLGSKCFNCLGRESDIFYFDIESLVNVDAGDWLFAASQLRFELRKCPYCVEELPAMLLFWNPDE